MRRIAVAALVTALATIAALSHPVSASGITLSGSGTVKDAQGHTFNYWLYTNSAYPCGQQGYHQFLVLQSGATVNLRNLLISHRGGAAGFYYNNRASYFPTNAFTVFLTQSDNQTGMFGHALDNGVPKLVRNNTAWRVLVPSYCSHDLYYGRGQFNAEDGFARWGYLADAAAIQYTTAHFPTQKIVTYGTSSGASGAFYQGIAQPGVVGIVMDSDAVDTESIVKACQAAIQPYETDWPCTCQGATCAVTLSSRIGFTINDDEPYLKIQRGEVSRPIYLVWDQYDQVWNFSEAHLQFDNLMRAIQQHNPGGKSIGSMVCVTVKDPCAVHSPTLDDTPPATSVYNWILSLTK